MRELIVGTRRSPLAQAQTAAVLAALRARTPDLRAQVRPILTTGDRRAREPLPQLGGKGVFTRELEEALLAGAIDLAVHSLKDLPVALPAGLTLGAILARGPAEDALVAAPGTELGALLRGARVGTSSLRRTAQLRRLWPHLQPVSIRGNVDTRLRQLDDGQVAALVLARAGLVRLGLAARIAVNLDPAVWYPAPGQGALAVEIRADDAPVAALVGALDDPPTARATGAERAVLEELGGGCQVPVGAWARCVGDDLCLAAMVCSVDGERFLEAHATGPAADPGAVARRVAHELLAQGATALLREPPTPLAPGEPAGGAD